MKRWFAWHPSDSTLVRLMDAELARRRRVRVEQHVLRCARCSARLRALSEASRALDEWTTSESAGTTEYQAMRARLRARMTAAGKAPAVRLPVAVLASAALIALIAVASPLRRGVNLRPVPDTLSSNVESEMLPDPSLTPGSVESTTAAQLCGVAASGSNRTIAPAVRQAVLRAYGMEHVPPDDYELDYLITPELGGASDQANLWPERYGSGVWNARVKDDLERLLPRLVCDGRLELATAQRDIAADWIAAYKKYFHAGMPLTTHASAVDDDEPPVAASRRLVALGQLARR